MKYVFLLLGFALCALMVFFYWFDDDDGVVINGVIWAKSNLDAPGSFASAYEDYGMFYQWNRKKGWSSTGNVTVWDSIGSTPSGDGWIEANDPCPAGWRVPTLTEMEKLFDTDKVTAYWITVKGVNGLIFTHNLSGKFIFLPAAGYRDYSKGALTDQGSYGGYWTRNGNDYYFLEGSDKPSNANHPANGLCIRCVRAE